MEGIQVSDVEDTRLHHDSTTTPARPADWEMRLGEPGGPPDC